MPRHYRNMITKGERIARQEKIWEHIENDTPAYRYASSVAWKDFLLNIKKTLGHSEATRIMVADRRTGDMSSDEIMLYFDSLAEYERSFNLYMKSGRLSEEVSCPEWSDVDFERWSDCGILLDSGEVDNLYIAIGKYLGYLFFKNAPKLEDYPVVRPSSFVGQIPSGRL